MEQVAVQVPAIVLLPVVLVWAATFVWVLYAALDPVVGRLERRLRSRMVRRLLWRRLLEGSVAAPAGAEFAGEVSSWPRAVRRRALDELAPAFEADLDAQLAETEADLERLRADMDEMLASARADAAVRRSGRRRR